MAHLNVVIGPALPKWWPAEKTGLEVLIVELKRREGQYKLVYIRLIETKQKDAMKETEPGQTSLVYFRPHMLNENKRQGAANDAYEMENVRSHYQVESYDVSQPVWHISMLKKDIFVR